MSALSDVRRWTFWNVTYLGTPKIEYQDIDKCQTDEDDIVFPLYVGQGRRCCLDIHQGREECSRQRPGDALRANVRREDLRCR